MSLAVRNMSAIQQGAALEQAILPVIVIGAGPVGVRAVRELRSVAPELPVLLFGEERYEPYNRVQLSGLLAGQHKVADIALAGDWLDEGAEQTTFLRRRIASIDPAARTVTDSLGQQHPYSKLVLAMGSRPFVPSLAGIGLTGVYTFRDMADAEKLAARRIHSTHTVALGAGLLGVEAAVAMRRHHTRVTLLDHNQHPMFRQLDSIAGRMLAEELRRKGIDLKLGTSLHMLLGTQKVEGAVLRDGSEISCDTVVVATGIRPNKDLAEQAGLAFGRGITVDAQMRTSDENIYAIGECCERQGELFGLVAPGYEQAAIAARNIADVESAATYANKQLATSLKAAGLSVFSMGEPEPSRSLHSVTWKGEGKYRRVTLAGGHIASINAIGDWHELPLLRDLAHKRKWIAPWQLWRFRRTGELFPADRPANIAAWPAEAIVCNCNSVSCGQLKSVVAEGVQSVEVLTARTQAGSGCGSCQPLLKELVGDSTPRERVKAFFPLSGLAGIAVLAAFVAVVFSIGYPTSVQLDWRWDELWRDTFNKQVSGFTILGLSLLSLLFSLRKRLPAFRLGNFAWWRIFHVALTATVLIALAVHTGFRLGDNLNQLLMACFLGLVLLGGLLGLVIAFEHRLSPALAQRWRSWGVWGHVLLGWPLPALLGAHILKSYYF